MLNKIINFSIKNKLIIILMTLGWIIYGIIELRKLPLMPYRILPITKYS